MKKQSGFAVLEVLILVVVVAILGFTAVTYMGHQQAATDTSATASVVSAPQISSTADLTTAENVVDQMDVDANTTDNSQLDSELANF